MLGLKKFINNQVAAQRSDEWITGLNTLIQRVGESTVVEDRREALQQLSTVLTDDPAAQSAFASVGFPTICYAIQMDREDPVIVRTGLECIAAAVASEHASRDEQIARAAAVNAEQFARTDGAIPLMLALLEGRAQGNTEVLHIRFLILQILHALLDANTLFAQQAILRIPTGVSQLVDLIGESEIMRNEALLILQRLVAGNPDAQKVAVFSGCLDKIFAVLREEDYLSGGIVSLDCLQLAALLLRDNAPNQRMFGELGYEKVLHHVLQKESEYMLTVCNSAVTSNGGGNGGGSGGSAEDHQDIDTSNKSQTLAAALDVVEACAAGGSIEKNALLPAICSFSALQVSPPWVRGAAWRVLAAAARLNSTTRQTLERQIVQVSREKKALLGQVAVQDCFENPFLPGRFAAGECFATILTPSLQTSVLQGLLVATEPHSLMQCIFLPQARMEDLLLSSRAAAALVAVVGNNPATKADALAARPCSSAQDTGILEACSQRLATSVIKNGNQPQGQELVAQFGALLIGWLPACPPAVQAFLHAISKTPFLVGVVMTENQFGGGGRVIRGVCAVLLGLCCLHTPPGSAIDPKVLLKAVVTQIGMERYEKAVSDFKGSLREAAGGGGMGSGGPGMWSPVAALWLLEIVDSVYRGVEALASGKQVPGAVDGSGQHAQQTAPPSLAPPPPSLAPPQPPPPQLPPPQPTSIDVSSPGATAIRRSQDNKEPAPPTSFLPSSLPNHQPSVAPPPSHPPPQHIHPSFDVLDALHAEIEELRLQNSRLEREAKETQADAHRLQGALAKTEADLQSLSAAYAALDAHATELQARLDGNGAGGGVGEEEVEKLIQAAREEAESEANAAMEDLLVCLGEEEAKVGELEALVAELKRENERRSMR